MKKFIDEVYELEKNCFKDKSWNLEQIKAHLERGKILVVRETEPIGYALYYDYEDSIEILRIGVRTEFQRKGYASSILNQLIALGKPIFLEVHEENKAAIQLYRKHGFLPLYIRKNYYANGKSALVMQRK